jgi:hypothetical protein
MGSESTVSLSHGPSGGVADSLDEAKAAFRAGAPPARASTVRPAESRPASAFLKKSGRDMLNLSISVDDPKRASGRDGGCMSGFMQPPRHGIVPLPRVET